MLTDDHSDHKDHADHQQPNQQYWVTTDGKFRFALEELPNHLQLIYGFLKELYHLIRPDTQRHLLRCVDILCLHCEVLSKSACREHPGFLFWVQENQTVAQLWNFPRKSNIARSSDLCLTLAALSHSSWWVGCFLENYGIGFPFARVEDPIFIRRADDVGVPVSGRSHRQTEFHFTVDPDQCFLFPHLVHG